MTKVIIDLESTGLLDNLIERILCISCYNVETKKTDSFCGADEAKILEDFFKHISNLERPLTIYGFNTESFDLPFLVRRAVVYKKRIPAFRSVDLRKVVNGFTYSYNRNEKGKLRDWAQVLGIPISTESGKEMFKLYNEGDFKSIQEHCEEDIKVTTKLFEHAEACGLINGQA